MMARKAASGRRLKANMLSLHRLREDEGGVAAKMCTLGVKT